MLFNFFKRRAAKTTTVAAVKEITVAAADARAVRCATVPM